VLIVLGLALLLVLHLVGGALGLSLLAAAVTFEAAEKGYLVWSMRRLPPAAGPEAMVGQPVMVLACCWPLHLAGLAASAGSGELTLAQTSVLHPY
jgi:hypothetical protein